MSLMNSVKNYSLNYFNCLLISQRYGHAFPQFVNLPKTTSIGGTGSVYDTKIKRKKEIKDPNYPDFEKIECLKWADWIMLRDVRRRIIFQRYNPEYHYLRTVYKSKLMPSVIRDSAYEDIKKLPPDSKYDHLQNRCAISSRARGKLIRWRISRHFWRQMADYNLLSGVQKSTW